MGLQPARGGRFLPLLSKFLIGLVMNFFIVYVLRSLKDGRRYTGMTSDLKRRLDEHKRGVVISTRNRCPMELIYTEEFENKVEAARREKFLKTGSGRQFLDSL